MKKAAPRKKSLSSISPSKSTDSALFFELSDLIEQSKRSVVSYVNNALTVLFWQVGNRINRHILGHKRASYDEQIVVTLSHQLVQAHGSNFEEKNLRRMVQFATIFPDENIVVTLSRQLSWSHFLALLPLKNSDSRAFYAQAAASGNWGVREMRINITNKVFERQSLAAMQMRVKQTDDAVVFEGLDPNGRFAGGTQGSHQQARCVSFRVQPAAHGGINSPPILHVATRCAKYQPDKWEESPPRKIKKT